jgi:hypothetical protein
MLHVSKWEKMMSVSKNGRKVEEQKKGGRIVEHAHKEINDRISNETFNKFSATLKD